MGVTPALVRHFFDREAEARQQRWPAEMVEEILGYGRPVGSEIEHHDNLHRGMERARALIAEAEAAGSTAASGTVIVADRMSGSKGRFRRSWHAPEGGIWLTLILANTFLPAFARLLPLAAGAAACETIRTLGPAAQVKWVNDVLIDGRKVAGILAETSFSPLQREEFLLVGIGLNGNNTDFPPELAATATSLRTYLGHPVDLPQTTALLLAKLAWNIGLLCRDESHFLAADDGRAEPDAAPGLLLQNWLQLSDTVGRRVLFGYDVQQNPLYEARVERVAADGGLVLRLADGSSIVEASGEILYLD